MKMSVFYHFSKFVEECFSNKELKMRKIRFEMRKIKVVKCDHVERKLRFFSHFEAA